MQSPILISILALVVWSLIVWGWMLATRLPAMTAARIHPQKAKFTSALSVLPDRVRAVADNYNHLMEQPTLFYALVVYVALMGHGDAIAIGLAWTYVAIRILHSLIQNTTNIVMYRFYAFVASTLVLVVLAVKELIALA